MSDATDGNAPRRIVDRLRSLAASVLELAQTRAQLLGTDVELQIGRLRSLALLAFGASLLFALALAFASMLVVAWFWETHRIAALAIVAVVHLAAAFACVLGARALLRSGPRPFAATIDEFRRDVAHLRR